MKYIHPTPWRLSSVFDDYDIRDAAGAVAARAAHGDRETAAIIVAAVNRMADKEWLYVPTEDWNNWMQERADFETQRDELRDLCVLLFDAVKHGNEVVDLPGIWNKAKEVLGRTDPEDKP